MAAAVEGTKATPAKSTRQPSTRNDLVVKLGTVYPRLRAQAKRQRTTMAALIRQGLKHVLDDEQTPDEPRIAFEPFQHASGNEDLHLLLTPKYAASLTARARAANMSRGEFVWSLLNGISPPAVPPDHDAALQALRTSTDRIAILSTDLAEFLRLLTRAAPRGHELEAYRASIMALNEDVRRHLKAASVLIGELRPYGKLRR